MIRFLVIFAIASPPPLEPNTFLCWAPGTPPNIVDASMRAEAAASQIASAEVSAQAFQTIGTGRWGSTATDGSTGSLGSPITLTWSIALDGAITDEGESSNLRARMAVIYAGQGANTTDPPDQQPWFTHFVTALNDLGKESGIIFVYEPNDDGVAMTSGNDGILDVRGDLRFLGANIDGNSNVLAYNYSPGYGDMVIDTNDSFFTSLSSNSLRLRNVVSHEVGHGLGLGHVCPIDNTKLMEPFINLSFVGAQFDEVFSLQRKYGDHLERAGDALNNDTFGNAAPLTLIPNAILSIPERLSIDDNGDSDYYQISVTADQTLTVTATPTSEAYAEAGTDSGGSCLSSTSYDFSSYHNLGIEIRAADGSTIVASSNTQGDGQAETLIHSFTSSGAHYVRVFGDTTDQTQIYDLSLILASSNVSLTVNLLDGLADEGDGANTASVTISSSEPVANDLTVALDPSGTASASDYSGNLSATILAGQTTSNTVTISATPDQLLEGTETLTLTIPPFTGGLVPYDLGTPASQDIDLLDTPTPKLNFSGSSLVAESFSLQNGAPDPGETIQVSVTLENTGSADATNVQATLNGPAGFLSFSNPQDYGVLIPSATSEQDFLFALNGTCGETIDLTLSITADNGISFDVSLSYTLGTLSGDILEDVEHGGAFPSGWSSSNTGAGSGWSPSTAQAASGAYSFHASGPSSVSESFLTSPILPLPTPAGSLSFTHSYDTETNWDGGVLEIAIDGGPWEDILDAGGVFTSNGYALTLSSSPHTPLGGRQAWSGNSGGFITTSLNLPPAAAGLPVQLRWIMATENSRASAGWHLDDITTPGVYECDDTGPTLTLSLSGGETSEDDPSLASLLTISTDPLLPTATAIPFTLVNTGTADPLLDVNGLTGLIIPVGQSFLTTSVTARPDALSEGEETLELMLAGTTESAFITIADSTPATPYETWAGTTLGETGDTDPLQDFDLDGSANIEEYAFQTKGADPQSQPVLATSTSATHFKLLGPPTPLPDGVTVTAETSSDLLLWSSGGITTTADGFEVPLGETQRFLRLVYSLAP